MLSNFREYEVTLDESTSSDQNFPVSLSRSDNGSTIVVSWFEDTIWDFFPYLPQENLKSSEKRINWAIKLDEQRKLTDPDLAPLLISAKRFLWSLLSHPIAGRRASHATVLAKAELLSHLLRWMVQNDLKQFKQLNGRTLEYVVAARLRYGAQGYVSKSTHHYRLHILEYLYAQRLNLVDSLTEHPWPLESSLSLSGQRRGGNERTPSTKVIPDDIARNLIAAASDYVFKKSQKLIKAVRAGERFAELDLVKQRRTDLKTEYARAEGYRGWQDLRSELISLRTACYILIGIFSGLRDSEILSLTDGCIHQDRSSDENTPLFWLHGTVYKMGTREKRWLVPSPVCDAIEILTQLSTGLRNRLSQEKVELEEQLSHCSPSHAAEIQNLSKRLHRARMQQKKLFLSVANRFGNEISVISGAQIGRDLKIFCAENGIHLDGRPYPLHAHQLRRTYARFVARAELGDLLTLKEHLGHWSLDMTVYYADGASDSFENDTELLDMINHEKADRHLEIVRTYLDSDEPLAGGAKWLSQWRRTVRTAQNKEELVKQYAATISLSGTGHSWCAGNAKGARCGGLCTFQAQTCVDCHFGIIGPEHQAIWEGIRDQQLEVLALDDVGPGGGIRANEILEQAEKVLRRLNRNYDEQDKPS